jgi:DNA-binding NarL/FixJ family response regulator
MTRVVIADDQAVVRGGLRLILEAHHLEVVGEAADGQAAVEAARELEPDVVLMDIRMPVLDGIEATRRLLSEPTRTRVLILTTYGIDEYVYEALRAGAAGFLLKTEPPERLADAVRVVAAGEALLGPEVTRRLIDRYIVTGPAQAQPPQALASLTPREHEVLGLIARGLSNAEIATSMYVSEGTVKTHVARILAKLNLRGRVQAVVFAYEHRLVEPGRQRR